MLPDDPSRAPRLVADNLLFLCQGVELLERLDDRQYSQRPSPKLASVGAHFRHCLEVYELFLGGLARGEVDYDARQRDQRVENDRLYARDRARIIMDELCQLPEESGALPVRVTMDRACEHPEIDPWSQSSVRRELQHLRSHTVHHYALIAATLRILEVDPGPELGVAPSTLAVQRS